VTVTQKAVEY